MMYPKINKILVSVRKLKNLIKTKKIERSLMLGMMNLNTLKVSTKVSLSNTFQIFIVTIFMDMDIMY